MSSPTYILEARNLVKEYPAVRAVDDVSFQIRAQQCFGLLGPNGAGKTTTVEIMEGVLPPTSGEVLYRGEAIGQRFRTEVGIQFQSTALQDFLTVDETLKLFQKLYHGDTNLVQLIEECALGELLERDTRKLSGGQRQRLLLALALVNNPTVLFLDEPTTGLDPQARRNFWHLLERIKSRDTTIILTTHYMEEAHILCDEIAIMDQGQVIAQGSPEALLKSHYDDVILQLPSAEFPDALVHIPHKLMETQELVEISTVDVSETLRQLAGHDVPLNHLRIRPRNLEDLFLELTGKDLRA